MDYTTGIINVQFNSHNEDDIIDYEVDISKCSRPLEFGEPVHILGASKNSYVLMYSCALSYLFDLAALVALLIVYNS